MSCYQIEYKKTKSSQTTRFVIAQLSVGEKVSA